MERLLDVCKIFSKTCSELEQPYCTSEQCAWTLISEPLLLLLAPLIIIDVLMCDGRKAIDSVLGLGINSKLLMTLSPSHLLVIQNLLVVVVTGDMAWACIERLIAMWEGVPTFNWRSLLLLPVLSEEPHLMTTIFWYYYWQHVYMTLFNIFDISKQEPSVACHGVRHYYSIDSTDDIYWRGRRRKTDGNAILPFRLSHCEQAPSTTSTTPQWKRHY